MIKTDNLVTATIGGDGWGRSETDRATLVATPVRPAMPVMIPDPAGRYTCFVASPEEVAALPPDTACDITHVGRLNTVWALNVYLRAINEHLPEGGYFTGCVETSETERERIYARHSRFVARIRYGVRFLLHRVMPKLPWTAGLYRRLTGRRRRTLSRAEMLGRLVYAGFEIVEERQIGDEFYFIGRKAGAPCRDRLHSWGPLFKMQRLGQGGRPIRVYKLRTMHPYSEYLQDYVYRQNNLQENGKLKDDFRVTAWGRVMRRLWIDELPMLINWLRGDLKLVGVRPLSAHYLSLYPEEAAARRLRHKPGLIPPFYADNPIGFDAIVASEMRYLEAYEQAPFRTDLRYLGKILVNIIIKGARSL